MIHRFPHVMNQLFDFFIDLLYLFTPLLQGGVGIFQNFQDSHFFLTS
jgi:hypothetical protein